MALRHKTHYYSVWSFSSHCDLSPVHPAGCIYHNTCCLVFASRSSQFAICRNHQAIIIMSNETSSDRIGLFIAIPCYFVLLGIAAIWANRKNRRFQKTDNDETLLSSHYLGGRVIVWITLAFPHEFLPFLGGCGQLVASRSSTCTSRRRKIPSWRSDCNINTHFESME